MNMVKKYYVFLILFLSVLIVFAYDSSSVFDNNIRSKQLDIQPMSSPLSSNDLKIQEKLKTTNEVVYHTPSSTSSIKDEPSQIDINLKYETSTIEFSRTIETTSEAEPTTDFDEIYSSPEDYTISTDNTKLSSEDYIISKENTKLSSKEYTISTENTKLSSEDYTISTENPELSTEEYTISTENPQLSSEEYTMSTNNTELSTEEYTTSTEKNELSSEVEETTELPETTTITNKCKNAVLTHINVTANPFSLNITWTTNREYCKFIYKINLMQIEFNNSTADTFILINNLNACEYYVGTVSIFYDNEEINIKEFDAITSEAVDPVEKIEYIQNESNFEISWLPPNRTKSCINYYKWKYFQDEKLVEENDVNTTNVIIPQPNGCLNNTFSVLAAINASLVSSPQNETYMNVQVNDPPIFVSAKMSVRSATTKWKLQKLCKPQTFLVKLDNENFTRAEQTINPEDKEILVEVNGLLAFTNYSFQGAIKNEVGLSEWSESSPTFQTKETEPDPPENLNIIQFENNTLYISWQNPQKWNGIEISYILSLEFIKLNYIPISGCPNISHETIAKEFDYSKNDYYFEFVEPASLFTISISAKSSGGIGRPTRKDIVTNEAVPDKPILMPHMFEELSLKNTYNVTLHVKWRTPCRVNGPIRHYSLQFTKCDDSNDNKHYIVPISSSVDYSYSFKNFLPDACYNLIVQLHSKSKYSEQQLKVTSPAGIPDVADAVDIPPPNATNDDPETTAYVYINKNMFKSTMGEIKYYAIIVAQTGCEEKPKSDEYTGISLGNWPKVVGNELCSDESKAYQATSIKWNPFLTGRTSSADTDDLKIFLLGIDKNCTSDICNRPLTPNTNYSIKYRGFTKKGFSDTQLIYFITASFVDGFQLGLIVGLIVGILAIAFIIAAALFYTKGKLNFTGWPRMESTSNISPAPLPVPLKKFKTHYAKMIENSGKIKNEFQLLSTISSDVTLSTKTAMLPINRKKNRYINILPYDQTRVKLNDTSITASDYINASYIRGYSEYNEYIATQGPTESTSTAFWQMIIEQNVKLIVMLTQFVESGKEKCHKYFPDLNSSHNYLNVITVECIQEELLSNFNRRIFKVTKGKEVKTIIHLQFNLWPDFGVPHELDHIIEFNKIIKDIKLKKPFLMVMHCSAGVGRTGTLIAVDILMQTIRDKRKVDIFGTVLNLRKQRMNMVQSEVQYEFLYQCINYLLSDNSRNLRSSRSFSKLQLDQIEENQITESNMLQTFKL